MYYDFNAPKQQGAMAEGTILNYTPFVTFMFKILFSPLHHGENLYKVSRICSQKQWLMACAQIFVQEIYRFLYIHSFKSCGGNSLWHD